MREKRFLSSLPLPFSLLPSYFICLFYHVCLVPLHLALLTDVREGCHHFLWQMKLSGYADSCHSCLFSSFFFSFFSCPLSLPQEVAVLPHCHSHHHQSANCWPWERTSLCLVIPFMHPAFSHSLPASCTQSSTSLTFTPHFPYHLSSSLSSSLRAVSLSLHPTLCSTHLLPLSVSCKLIFSLCSINVWFGRCCIPGWNPFCIQ